MVARFSAGTFARIEAALVETEDHTDFVREAVDRKLARRARWKRKSSKTKRVA
jgi:hypothetical protein